MNAIVIISQTVTTIKPARSQLWTAFAIVQTIGLQKLGDACWFVFDLLNFHNDWWTTARTIWRRPHLKIALRAIFFSGRCQAIPGQFFTPKTLSSFEFLLTVGKCFEEAKDVDPRWIKSGIAIGVPRILNCLLQQDLEDLFDSLIDFPPTLSPIWHLLE